MCLQFIDNCSFVFVLRTEPFMKLNDVDMICRLFDEPFSLSNFPIRLNETGAGLTHTHISIDSGPPGLSH